MRSCWRRRSRTHRSWGRRSCPAPAPSERRRQEAEELLAELLRAHDLADCFFHQLPLVLAELGRGREYLVALGGMQATTPWLEAGCAAATGDFGRAADVYGKIGARAAEAQARLLGPKR